MFSFLMCMCVCAQQTLNSNSAKTVKATDFNIGVHVPRDSPAVRPLIFLEKGHGQGHVTPKFSGVTRYYLGKE